MGFGQPQTSSPTLTPQQQNLQNVSSNFLANQVQSGGLPAYPGPLTAGLSPAQESAIGSIGAVGEVGAPTTAQGLNTLGFTAGGGYLNDPFTSNLLQANQNLFNQRVASGEYSAPFQLAGQTGFSTPSSSYSNLAGAQFQASQAGLAENAYQTERQLQQQAAQQAVPLGLGAASTGLSALTVPQQTQQQAFTNAYNEYLRQQSGPFAAAVGMPSITGQTTQQQFGPSPFSELFGGLASLAGPFAMLKYAGVF